LDRAQAPAQATAGVGLISPPRTTTSTTLSRNLAPLIHDLKNANEHAACTSSLVSDWVSALSPQSSPRLTTENVVLSSGPQTGGHRRGPRSSLSPPPPWERRPWPRPISFGCSTVLRYRIRCKVDGAMKTGRTW